MILAALSFQIRECQENITMKTSSGLYYGNAPSGVARVLLDYFQQLPLFRCAMVLTIDSAREPSDIVSILSQYEIVANVEAATVLVGPEQLQLAAKRGVLAGFDEVWLLGKDRPERDVSRRELVPFDPEGLQKALPRFEAAMKDTHCVLALSDGCHLSYATYDADFVAFIESQYPKGTWKIGMPYE